MLLPLLQKLNFFGAPLLSAEQQARMELAELDAQVRVRVQGEERPASCVCWLLSPVKVLCQLQKDSGRTAIEYRAG